MTGRPILRRSQLKLKQFRWDLGVAVFGFVFLSASISRADVDTQADVVFKRAEPYVFQIKTAISAESPKASYGSGWVVRKDGYLITNYHVVSSAVQEPDKYKIFLVVGATSQPAQILGVDVIHDLALIKVDRQFPDALKVQNAETRLGTRIFSLGLPKDLNMSIVTGTYNGIVKNGLYENIHMSSPINEGMSGGPTLDGAGRVIGVNVSIIISSQNIAFAVPSRFVTELMSRVLQGKTSPENLTTNFKEQIQAQLTQVQASLIEDLEANGRETIKLGGWTVAKPTETLKCWLTNNDDQKKRYNSVGYTCYLNQASFIKDNIYSGSYEVSYEMFENRRLNIWRYYDLINLTYNSSAYYQSLFLFSFSTEDSFTRNACEDMRIQGQDGVVVQVNYCLRGLVDYPNLLNADVKFVTLSQSDPDSRTTLMGRMRLQGFNLENIQRFIQWQLGALAWGGK